MHKLKSRSSEVHIHILQISLSTLSDLCVFSHRFFSSECEPCLTKKQIINKGKRGRQVCSNRSKYVDKITNGVTQAFSLNELSFLDNIQEMTALRLYYQRIRIMSITQVKKLRTISQSGHQICLYLKLMSGISAQSRKSYNVFQWMGLKIGLEWNSVFLPFPLP